MEATASERPALATIGAALALPATVLPRLRRNRHTREDGWDIADYDYTCGSTVRVIEYATHDNVAPIRHGHFRFRCH
jgi:hypothetical protein